LDTRKIMALGKSSLVVSLPKDWVRSNNLKRGDLVELDVPYTDLKEVMLDSRYKMNFVHQVGEA
jgi:phosphate uptake regulator